MNLIQLYHYYFSGIYFSLKQNKKGTEWFFFHAQWIQMIVQLIAICFFFLFVRQLPVLDAIKAIMQCGTGNTFNYNINISAIYLWKKKPNINTLLYKVIQMHFFQMRIT